MINISNESQNTLYKPEWYENWFNQLYPKLYPNRNLEEAKSQIESIIKLLGQGESCLDIACGTGRHLKFLANYFSKSVGIDLSEDLIQLGVSQGNFDKSRVLIADMRRPNLNEKFDLVCNFFTGFGYFQTDEEHKKMLNTWQSLIKPKGKILIDYLNRDYVINTLETRSIKIIDGYKITETKSLSKDKSRIEKEIKVEKNGQIKNYFESVRMYSIDEMIYMLGHNSVQTYGDFSWNTFSKNSPRLILIGESN